jgi:hypothetical protein
MKGDVKIIDGKLCYSFEISDEWISKLNEKSLFTKGNDLWKVKSVNEGEAWCYLADPFKTISNREIKRLEECLADLEHYIDDEIDKLNHKKWEDDYWNSLPVLTKIKVWIKKLFKIRVAPFFY